MSSHATERRKNMKADPYISQRKARKEGFNPRFYPADLSITALCPVYDLFSHVSHFSVPSNSHSPTTFLKHSGRPTKFPHTPSRHLSPTSTHTRPSIIRFIPLLLLLHRSPFFLLQARRKDSPREETRRRLVSLNRPRHRRPPPREIFDIEISVAESGARTV